MEFYLLIWLGLVYCSFFDITNMRVNKKYVFIFYFFCMFILLGGIRYQVGTDWEQYYNYFVVNNRYIDFFNEIDYTYEAGYRLLNYIVKNVSDSFNVFLLIFTSIICFLKYKSILSYTKLPLIVLLLNYAYFLGDIFNIRQSLGVAITIYSVRFVLEKNLLKFILTIIIATLFHRTAIVFLLAYWLYYKEFSNRTLFLLLTISCFIGFSGVIGSLITNLTGIDNIYVDKLLTYGEDSSISYSDVDNDQKMFFSFGKKIVLLIPFWFFRKKMKEKYECYNGFFNYFFMANIIAVLFSISIPEVSFRLVVFYNFFEIFIIASFVNLYNKLYLKIFIWLLIVLYSLIYFYYNINKFIDAFVPYRSILG